MLIKILDEQVSIVEPHERKGIYPSELDNCKRCIWYSTHGTEVTNPIQPSSRIVMAIGNLIENYVLDNLAKSSDIKNIERQKVVKLSINGSKRIISGKMDAVITYKDDSVEGCELKSGHGYSTTSVMKNELKDDWLFQICSYLNFSDIKKFRLFYVDRANGFKAEFRLFYENGVLRCLRVYDDKEFDVIVRQLSVEELTKRIIEIDELMDSDIIPDRLGTIEAKKDKKGNIKLKHSWWKCGGYCEFQDICWRDYEPEGNKKEPITMENF